MSDRPSQGAVNSSVPRWVWAVFAVLIALSSGCFAAAIVLGGMMAPPKPTPGSFKNVEAVLPREEVMSPVVPLDMPLMPTEVPAPAHVSADIPAPVEVSPVAVAPAPAAPRWVSNAVFTEVPPGVARLAIVIDDMGLDGANSTQAVRDLPAPVTFSFLPYGPETGPLARASKSAGHEILVHVPMEPLPHGQIAALSMGPHGLTVGMSAAEIEDNLMKNLDVLKELAVGANNHMGSRFTAWPDGMRVVLRVLQREGLLFLDSRTIAPTAVREASSGLDLPVLGRDVFLDHELEPEKVRAELVRAVEMAKKHGFAVAIGHPLPVTLQVLNEELPHLVSSGVVLVPLSAGIGK